jgi:hypothetical protein
VRTWNARFCTYFEEIAAMHPPRVRVEMADLADMLSCVVDGAIIMGRLLREPRQLERQIMAFRSFVSLVFTQPAATADPRLNAVAAE